MVWRILADGVLAVHMGFLVFVVVGGFFVRRWPRVAWVHLPAMVWGVWVEVTGGVCPLTPLENRLRRAGGEAGYAGGFIEQYLVPVLYPSGLTRTHQLLLGCALLVVNALAYLLVVRSRRRRRDLDRQPAEP